MTHTRLEPFHGGLHLHTHKRESTQQPILTLPPPAQLILPLQQHIGHIARAEVRVGDVVRGGQRLARADGYLSAALHAPAPGRVVAIESRPIAHPSGLDGPCIVLDVDPEGEWIEALPPLPDEAPADAIRQRVRECGIVGLGGAAFPTAVKLNAKHHGKPADILVLNAAECEPYITCDEMLLRERADQVVDGMALLVRALDVKHVLIGIEDSMPQARQALEAALAGVSFEAEVDIELCSVPTVYPTGGEKQLIQVLTGREVPSGGLPIDIGVLCQNVGTAVAVAHAVRRGRALTSRLVTVTGDGVAQPRVVEALIGTPMHSLIEACGGYTIQRGRLIVGGPMMGFTLPHDRAPITKGNNCLLITAASTFEAGDEMPCIRCGACVEVCPAHLLPQQLYWFARSDNFEQARQHNLFDCIECGCCANVCPSHIPLVQYYRYAKSEIWSRDRDRQKADIARQRHESRQQRLEREQAEREARARKRKAARSDNNKTSGEDDPRQAVLDKVRKRREAANSGAD